MRYDVTLALNYDYGGPADHARNMLRVLPRDLPGRQLVSSEQVTVDPLPCERRDTVDFFGNRVTQLAFEEPVRQLEIKMHARVDVFAAEPAFDLSPRPETLCDDLAGLRDIGPNAPHHFLHASPRVPLDRDMTAWAQAQVPRGMTTCETVLQIGAALGRDMHFDSTVTDVDTPPAQAFRNRRGVCQDFSHVMIACLRGLGIPAGYVSGFLRTEPPVGQPRLSGADAMHAWVRAWCGGQAGWIEYDPTNTVVAGLDHLVIGYGRDYADIAPVRGAVRAAGLQISGHTVDVVPWLSARGTMPV